MSREQRFKAVSRAEMEDLVDEQVSLVPLPARATRMRCMANIGWLCLTCCPFVDPWSKADGAGGSEAEERPDEQNGAPAAHVMDGPVLDALLGSIYRLCASPFMVAARCSYSAFVDSVRKQTHMLKKKEDEVKRLRTGLIEKERFLMEQDKLNESLSKVSNRLDAVSHYTCATRYAAALVACWYVFRASSASTESDLVCF
jgi:hypothetical protein